MAAVTSYKVEIGLLYEDDTTRKYTFDNVADTALENVKSHVRAINTNTGDTYAPFYQTFVSNGGASVVKIASAAITATETEVIYNG